MTASVRFQSVRSTDAFFGSECTPLLGSTPFGLASPCSLQAVNFQTTQ